MSRNPYQHPIEEPGIPATPRVSGMSVASLVFGLLCCIPGSGLIGTILGGAGLVSISKSDGRLSGRGLAFTGLILGLLGTVGWIGVGAGTIWFFKQAQQFVQPVQMITSGDIAGARQRLSASTAAALTDEKATEFTDALKAEVGAPKRMPKGLGEWLSGYAEVGQMIEGAQDQAPKNTAPVPLPVHFEKEIALVMVYLEEDSSTSSGFPPIKNISVHTKSGKTIWLLPPGP